MQEEVQVRESMRAKHLRVQISVEGLVTVIKPIRVSERAVERFVIEHKAWIAQTKEKMRRAYTRRLKAAERAGGAPVSLARPRKGSRAEKEARTAARMLVTSRLMYFNEQYRFSYGSISIRNQKTRWGSCSASGNLSFNYRLHFLPPELSDYVIVHELCHTKQHNHSAAFWELVAQAIPDYKQRRTTLRARYEF